MTAADEFTRASPQFIRAVRHGANTGQGFEVSGSTTGRGHVLAVLVGAFLAAVVVLVEVVS